MKWLPSLADPEARKALAQLAGTFVVCFVLGLWFWSDVLWACVGVFLVVEATSVGLIYQQRKLILLQDKNMRGALDLLRVINVQLACSEWNLVRARTELARAGIDFEMIVPPAAAATNKETLS